MKPSTHLFNLGNKWLICTFLSRIIIFHAKSVFQSFFVVGQNASVQIFPHIALHCKPLHLQKTNTNEII